MSDLVLPLRRFPFFLLRFRMASTISFLLSDDEPRFEALVFDLSLSLGANLAASAMGDNFPFFFFFRFFSLRFRLPYCSNVLELDSPGGGVDDLVRSCFGYTLCPFPFPFPLLRFGPFED